MDHMAKYLLQNIDDEGLCDIDLLTLKPTFEIFLERQEHVLIYDMYMCKLILSNHACTFMPHNQSAGGSLRKSWNKASLQKFIAKVYFIHNF